MRVSKRYRLPAFFALILAACAVFFGCGLTAYAGGDTPEISTVQTEEIAQTSGLAVNDVWLDGDTLRILVADDNGSERALELYLPDYASPENEFVTIQATDGDGNLSEVIKFENPYYDAKIPQASESAAFAPEGTGEVVDNVNEQAGKEFFTVKTADGNVFYLIVDRQRNADNVYLLSAVDEDDLLSMAKPGKTVSAASEPEPVPEPVEPAPAPAPEPVPEPAKGGSGGTIAIIVVVIVVVGGGAYYFKIMRPKQQKTDDFGNSDDDFDDDNGDDEFDLDQTEDGDDN